MIPNLKHLTSIIRHVRFSYFILYMLHDPYIYCVNFYALVIYIIYSEGIYNYI
jgi:hypothetical protein